MLSTYEKHSRAKLVATLASILVVMGVVLVADHIKSRQDASAAFTQSSPTATASETPTATTTPTVGTATSTPTPAPTATPASNTSGYKDGAYTASSSYFVPHGDEQIQVNLTLKNGTITDVSIQNSENDFDSARFQEDFAAAYKSRVVGKKISGLRLSNIAGASDTTQGFNDAVGQIASKAQA